MKSEFLPIPALTIHTHVYISPVYLTGHYCETPRSQVNNGPDYGSDYGSEFDEDDLSESESGIYDPETGMPYADIDEDTDGERFEEIEAAAAAPAYVLRLRCSL